MVKTKSNKVLFLYAEITPYLIGCVKNFVRSYPKIQLNIVCKKVFSNLELKELDFEIVLKENFKSQDDFFKYVTDFDPNLIIVSGRMDKDYLSVSKKYKKKINVVTVQDTMFSLSFKQLIKTLFSRVLYHRYFNSFWGVGIMQTRFAKSIGYKEKNIKTGFYVADEIFFKNKREINFKGVNNFNFLYVGRLVKEKNIIKAAKVIEQINLNNKSQHKLILIGQGYLLQKLKKFNCIKYLGLKTQYEIIQIVENSHAFILPSRYEPWGVVVHEMTAVGMPVLVSNKSGSSYDLVIDGYNGFKFNPNSFKSMYNSIMKFIDLDSNAKTSLSKNSTIISNHINHKNWNKIILSYLDNNDYRN